ncbi:MAG TPA: carbohydrate porin [Stellaceae bacterium]|nr:carbohydrate porin [Stellaceae bacterium]
MKQFFAGLLALGFIMALAADAWAEGEAPDASEAPPPAPALAFGGDFWTRPKLTGDWGGQRDQFAAQGLTINFDVTYTFQGVASGGIPNTGTALGNTTLGALSLGLDTTKANLWPGGLFSLRLEARTGESAFGRAGTVSPIDNDAITPNSPGNLNKNVFGLTELTYTQFLSPQFGVFGGLLNTYEGDDNPIAGNPRSNMSFLNLSFLMSLVEAATVPNASLGGGGVFILSPDIIGKVLIFNSQESATINPIENSSGTTFGTEWTVKHKLFDQPGGQLLGFMYGIGQNRTAINADPRVFIANLIVNSAIPKTSADSWSFYYNAHQYIQGDEQRGWGPFLRFGVSDGNPNPIKWNLAAGIGGKGPFSGREDDRWGAGFYYLGISDTALLNLLKLNSEVGGEMFYNLGITPAMHLTFDAQAVSSARPRQQTAVILGARVGVNF